MTMSPVMFIPVVMFLLDVRYFILSLIYHVNGS